MALRANHVQAAGLTHLITKLLRALLRRRQLRVPRLLVALLILKRIKTLRLQLRIQQNFRVAAKHDIRTTTSHVGRHSHLARKTSLRNNAALFLMVLRVQHVVLDALTRQQLRQVLRTLHGRGTNQDRLALLHMLRNILSHSGELRLLRLINQIITVHTLVRLVRRNRHHINLVNLVQLRSLSLCSTRHAGKLVVQTEVVLQRDRSQRLVLIFDLDVFLRLDRLVHALVITTPRKDTARKGVHDHDLTLTDDVVLIALKQLLRLQRVIQVAHQLRVLRGVQVVNAQLVLNELNALFRHANRALTLIHLIVDTLTHTRGKLRKHGVELA